MENHEQTSFRFEIDNFSEKKDVISPNFISGGCEWFVRVWQIEDHLAVTLSVPNLESLRHGWERRAKYSFIVLNQSGKELGRTFEAEGLFCFELLDWCHPKVMPMTKLQEGYLENNKLMIEVQVKVVEVVHEGGVTTEKEMFNIESFDVLYTRVSWVSWIFVEHPDVAVDVRIKNQLLRTAYMNVLLGLIETLDRPPRSLSETELRDAHIELSELTEAGFKVDWLKTKLEEVSLVRKDEISDGSQVEELEEHVKNLKLELDNEKTKSSNASDRVFLLEKEVSDLKIELDKERSAKSPISKVALLKDAADSFWNTTNLGIRQRRAGYQKVDSKRFLSCPRTG
ncbi:MATH/TRAF domain [Arabidopsis suecica]|uniref:MATH/TRAF domain n=1 Tax=Arabidopsis suecica TaxID=45249 RepID=A0A8T2ALC5_ARASU|nr:MATH/TRAF domain [Arabidopsis suecica]